MFVSLYTYVYILIYPSLSIYTEKTLKSTKDELKKRQKEANKPRNLNMNHNEVRSEMSGITEGLGDMLSCMKIGDSNIIKNEKKSSSKSKNKVKGVR